MFLIEPKSSVVNCVVNSYFCSDKVAGFAFVYVKCSRLRKQEFPLELPSLQWRRLRSLSIATGTIKRSKFINTFLPAHPSSPRQQDGEKRFHFTLRRIAKPFKDISLFIVYYIFWCTGKNIIKASLMSSRSSDTRTTTKHQSNFH